MTVSVFSGSFTRGSYPRSGRFQPCSRHRFGSLARRANWVGVPPDDVEILRRSFEVWNSGDLEQLIDMMHPDLEFVPLRSQLDGSVYRGPEGMRQFAADMADEWEYQRIVSDEFRQVGQAILMLGRFNARARGSGMEIEFPCGWVGRLTDGKVSYLRTYSNAREALEAVGLSEPT